MTPEERKLVIELFDRLATLEDAQRDPEAESLIKDELRQAPNAVYALVQTVLVQDEALKRANARIREFDGGGDMPARDTSFLDSMRERFSPPPAGRGSVPSVRPDTGSPATPSAMSPAWRTGSPRSAETFPPPSAPMGMGGSFLGTAASAAAGVIGGALLLDGIRSMMGHHSTAHAAFDPSSGSSSPWSGERGGGGLAHDAGVDDIARTPGAGAARDNAYGLLDDGSEGEPDATDDDGDDIDDGSFDSDDSDQ
jgi:hypothetical protein